MKIKKLNIYIYIYIIYIYYLEKSPTKLLLPMSAKSDSQLPGFIYRNNDFFGSLLKAFPLEATILAIVGVIEKVQEIKKNQHFLQPRKPNMRQNQITILEVHQK